MQKFFTWLCLNYMQSVCKGEISHFVRNDKQQAGKGLGRFSGFAAKPPQSLKYPRK